MERAEAAGLGVAVAGHAALLAALTLGLFAAAGPPPATDTFDVSYVDDIALTSASPMPNAAPPAPSEAPELGTPEEAAALPSLSAPAPVPSPAPVRQPIQPSRQAAPSPPDPRLRRRPEEVRRGQGERSRGRRRLDLDPNSFGADSSPSRSRATPAATYGQQERASVRQAIARALMRCQRQPLPAPEAAAIRVEYRITLNRDGSLAEADFLRVINPNPALAQYERRMRDLALNVITSCTPIRGLPAEYYEVPGGWRQFPYQFDPRSVR
ncbi:MAG: hypothetical protein ACT4N8_15445 [Sphingosinicella sp.]|uniref:hypothetical protein n=1 Tax=Sphingosinicella sp. TaxID=1917971 RepID=UPI004037BEAD